MILESSCILKRIWRNCLKYLKTSSSDVNININENIGINNGVEYIIPNVPPYFNIANLKATGEAKKIIHLEVPTQNIPTSIAKDGCAVNLQGSVLLDEIYGIKSPLNIFAFHASAGTIRCLCTSQTMCQSNAKSLYKHLRTPLKHFAKSPKSSEMLLQALNNLEQCKVHLIN